jgi:hypothetical protein
MSCYLRRHDIDDRNTALQKHENLLDHHSVGDDHIRGSILILQLQPRHAKDAALLNVLLRYTA